MLGATKERFDTPRNLLWIDVFAGVLDREHDTRGACSGCDQTVPCLGRLWTLPLSRARVRGSVPDGVPGELLTGYIHSEYSLRYERPHGPARPPRSRTEPRLRPEADYDTFFGLGRPLPYGQVYATLSRLARDGKAIVGDAEPGAGPDRKRYNITETGRNEVEAWLSEPIPAEPHLQTDLFVKVVLSLMLGRRAEEYLDAQRRTPAPDARAHRPQQKGALIDSLLADHGLSTSRPTSAG